MDREELCLQGSVVGAWDRGIVPTLCQHLRANEADYASPWALDIADFPGILRDIDKVAVSEHGFKSQRFRHYCRSQQCFLCRLANPRPIPSAVVVHYAGK